MKNLRKLFTLILLGISLNEKINAAEISIISTEIPTTEEKNFVNGLMREGIIKIDGKQDFIDFVKNNLYTIAHNKVGRALLIDIYLMFKKETKRNVIITPTFFCGSCCWPSKSLLITEATRHTIVVPENFSNLKAAHEESVVIELDELQKKTVMADDERIVGFSKALTKDDPYKIKPIYDTPDLTIFHELNHARIFLKTYVSEDTKELSEVSATLHPHVGSLNTPIYAIRDGEKVPVLNIMVDPMEEVQNIGYTKYNIPSIGVITYTDPICENSYRMEKKSEDNIRYPYLHDLFDLDIRECFFQNNDSKNKIREKSIDNLKKI